MLLISYIFLLIISTLVLSKTNKKNGIVGGYSGFVFSMIVYYLVLPILMLFNENGFRMGGYYGFDDVVWFVYSKENQAYYYAILIFLVGFISFNFGYKTKVVFQKKEKIKKSNEEKKLLINEANIAKLSRYVANVTFIVGGTSFLIFIIAIGGIGRALSLAEVTRGFEVSVASISYIAGISKLLSRMVTVASILYLYLIQVQQRNFDKILFSISLLFSILFYLSNAGRTPLITFLVIFLYFFLRKYFKKVWRKIIFLGILFLPLIDILDDVFRFFQTGIWTTIEVNYLNYIRQFSFPYSELLNIRDITDLYGFKYFKYVFTDILSLLPGVGFEASYVNTSEFFKGLNWRMIGGVPNDVMSYGYIQMGLLGVSITLFMWGKILLYMDETLLMIDNDKGRQILSVSLATQIYQVVFSADIGPIIQTNYILVFLFIMLFIYRKVYKSTWI